MKTPQLFKRHTTHLVLFKPKPPAAAFLGARGSQPESSSTARARGRQVQGCPAGPTYPAVDSDCDTKFVNMEPVSWFKTYVSHHHLLGSFKDMLHDSELFNMLSDEQALSRLDSQKLAQYQGKLNRLAKLFAVARKGSEKLSYNKANPLHFLDLRTALFGNDKVARFPLVCDIDVTNGYY